MPDQSSVSRRRFLKLSSTLPLGAAALPAMARAGFAAPPATTERAASGGPAVGYIDTPANVTLLNINEFPAGPTPAAVDIMTRMATSGNRYYMSETRQFTADIAAYHGVKPGNVTLYAGSSEPLQFTTMAFTSPTRSFVTADPSYENGANTAAAGGAAVHKIPLKADYTHDIKAMAAADPNAGLFYICNPNNPTGVPIKRTEIEWLLENKPTGSIVLVDEAYIHFSDAESVIDLVAKDKDLVVIRTFSKIYAMGGLRFGYAVGRQDLLAKLHYYGINFMATTAVQCAKVQLNDKQLIPARKQMIADNRNRTLDFLAKQGYTATPSQTNCFMVDVKRPGRSVATALAHQNVVIGRSWAIWPNSVRVSVGSPQDMAAFQTAFVEAMKMPAEKMSQLVHPYPHLLEEPVC
jgi:histidinol-phosphate aminotransferase